MKHKCQLKAKQDKMILTDIPSNWLLMSPVTRTWDHWRWRWRWQQWWLYKKM